MSRKVLLAGSLGLASALLPALGEDIAFNEYESVHLVNTSTGVAQPLLMGKRSEAPEQVAREAINQLVGEGDWRVLSSYLTKHNQVTHLAFRRYINGVECSNCDATVNINKIGQVLNMGYTALPAERVLGAPKASPLTKPTEAITAFVKHAKIPGFEELGQPSMYSASEEEKYSYSFPSLAKATKSSGNVTVALKYVVSEKKGEGAKLDLAWLVDLETELPRFASYEAWMDAISGAGTPVAVIDHVDWADSIYEVYPIPNLDPLQGDREVLVGPADREASPFAWQEALGRVNTVTQGNNVYAQENWNGDAQWENNYRPDGGSLRNFRFPVNFDDEPREYADASIANLFFWNNVVHDVFQLHGFDEASGNFQEDNFDRGGLGVDAVQANAQDGAGFNNANMLTRADGVRGRMRMYLWNQVSPMLDGDFDGGIVVHEYGHGISNRLTGGPATTGCLGNGQPGGMGEGWSDWWAIMFMQSQNTDPEEGIPMGLYAAGRGIRPFDYTMDMEVNPQTFEFLNQPAYSGVHAIGSVWCSILYGVYWDMRTQFGFDADWYRGEAGNNILFQNVVDGLKLQPCSPNFVQARDAIILADSINYDDEHACVMWTAFARRGLGFSATSQAFNPVVEAFDLPPACQ